MNRSTKIFFAAIVVVLGVAAFWFLRPVKRIAPEAAPIVQTPAAPVAPEPDAPVVAQAPLSETGQPTPAAHAAKLQPALQTTIQPLAQIFADPTTQPISPAATLPVEPRAKLYADETTATARMYAAHAPLRMPEVADPDSASNKQILQTMVLKALAQPASLPPASQQVTSAK